MQQEIATDVISLLVLVEQWRPVWIWDLVVQCESNRYTPGSATLSWKKALSCLVLATFRVKRSSVSQGSYLITPVSGTCIHQQNEHGLVHMQVS